MRLLVAVISIVVLLLASACFTPSIKNGVKPPDIILPTPSGENIDLTQYKGKVILLNFWATWCGPCRKELPELASLEKEFGQDVFIVLAINMKEPIEKVKTFVAERRLGLRVLLDRSGKVSKRYGVRALPANILIGRDGKVRATSSGYTKRMQGELRKQIKELVGRKH